jgi:ABC-type glutathione transport system ATPase component
MCFIGLAPTVRLKRQEAMSLLAIKDLKKVFFAPDGTRQAVISVKSFALKKSEHLAIEGGSGTGKTTFLNLILEYFRLILARW